MKLPKLLIQKKKLRASTARRAMQPDEMDYEEMSEPNMKLSRALLIVLVLHVVAVAGIVAFNTIKSRQGAFPQRPAAVEAMASANQESSAASNQTMAKAEDAKPALAVVGDDRESEPPKAALAVSAADSGKVYVVVKGDNPVTIARRLKVSESELLQINHIDDPRKLQIGQKLIVPAAKKTKK